MAETLPIFNDDANERIARAVRKVEGLAPERIRRPTEFRRGGALRRMVHLTSTTQTDGRYPGTMHLFDAAGNVFEDSVGDCWVVDANNVPLIDEVDGTPVYYDAELTDMLEALPVYQTQQAVPGLAADLVTCVSLVYPTWGFKTQGGGGTDFAVTCDQVGTDFPFVEIGVTYGPFTLDGDSPNFDDGLGGLYAQGVWGWVMTPGTNYKVTILVDSLGTSVIPGSGARYPVASMDRVPNVDNPCGLGLFVDEERGADLADGGCVSGNAGLYNLGLFGVATINSPTEHGHITFRFKIEVGSCP